MIFGYDYGPDVSALDCEDGAKLLEGLEFQRGRMFGFQIFSLV
jgi:hypothetical protein